jgi:hypothetical protein
MIPKIPCDSTAAIAGVASAFNFLNSICPVYSLEKDSDIAIAQHRQTIQVLLKTSGGARRAI